MCRIQERVSFKVRNMKEGLRAGGVVAGMSSDLVGDNSNQSEGVSKSNVDTGTTGADRKHDGCIILRLLLIFFMRILVKER
ncbi:hypothetical protein Tco_0746228 [Tanacetum coccineum]